MKNKIVILVIACLILVIGVVGFITWNNRVVSTITLDINPSIKIDLNKNNKVKNVVALNDDAKKVVSNDIKSKSLEETLSLLIVNLVDNGYADKGNDLDVILHVEGKITSTDVSNKIEFEFGKKEVHTEIVVIDSISEEDEELAKKYNVSPAKVAYIKSIIENNENINIDDLSNKSVSELNETKTTGKYCENGYTLEGDWCLKEINRVPASNGKVCPTGYWEYEGKCYMQIPPIDIDTLKCNDGFKLIDKKCVMDDISDAFGICDSGEYDNGYCVEKVLIGDAEEFCRLTPATDILLDHKCYGPKPTINGRCLNNDKLMNGGCVDMNSYYESDYRCKTGNLESDHKCYKEVKTNPVSYYCDGDAVLNGTKCELHREEDTIKEKKCPSGYTAINSERCIDYSKIVEKTNGFYCDIENSRLVNNECIIYESVEAKHY